MYIVPLGEVPRSEIERARRALEDQTRRLVIVLPALPQSKGIQSAKVLLDTLLLSPPPDMFRVLGITQSPLYAGPNDPVIGYARIGERALVYSTDQLSKYATEAARRGYVRRIIAHELGHTYGAVHCDTRCVMRDAEDGHDIDLLAENYCPAHALMASRALTQGPQHLESLVRLGAEQIRLGQWTGAIYAYRKALRHDPKNAKARTALGVALMAHGELSLAEDAFVQASEWMPDAPQPYYGRAVLYAAGYAPKRAPAFLEAAVSRDRHPRRAHRAAGILYQDVLENPARAVYHFEAHLNAGGRDTEVIARLVYLISPTTLVLNPPETIVARWNPTEGLQLAKASP